MADNNKQERVELTRRAFTRTVGGAAAVGAAVDPAVADEERETERRTGASLDPVGSAFTPEAWNVTGPFQYQRRDVEIGWLFPEGGEGAFSDGDRTPADGQRFQAAYAGGATVEWGDVAADGDTVPLDFSRRIDPTKGELTPLQGEPGLFDDFHDWFGIGGVLYAKGYAFTTFERDDATRAVLETDASVVWLNGQRYEQPPVGVTLQEGTNYLLAKTTLTFGSGSLSLSFRPPRAPVEVNELDAFRGTPQNAVLPDLRVGEQTERPASVRVTNTTGEEITDAELAFAPDSDLLVPQREEIDPPLAPFETRRINTTVETKRQVREQTVAAAETDGGFSTQSLSGGDADDRRSEVPAGLSLAATASGEPLDHGDAGPSTAGALADSGSPSVLARVEAAGATATREVPLRVRGPDATKWQTTFRSEVDGSVQAFSVQEPPNPGSPGPFELIFALHGANVPSINQAGAYVQRENTYVVAPNARGPANYDHEDLGRVDDLETLRVAKDRFDIDENSVYLTGHSMGGHGTWHVGLTNPQHWAGLAPSAGWTDHETYLVVPFMHDKLWTYPQVKAVKEQALYKNLALPKAENAKDGTLPAFALHGGEDTSVPTMHPRTYCRGLANLGLTVRGEVGKRYSNPDPDEVDVAFLEVPGQGHWWDAGIGPGNDSVNHPDMMKFLRSTERDPYPASLHFYTTNLRVEHEKFWVAVLQQDQVHAPTRVTAEVRGDEIHLDTENVALLAIDPRVLRETSAGSGRTPRIVVDGETAHPSRGRGRGRGRGDDERGSDDDGRGRGEDRGRRGDGRGRGDDEDEGDGDRGRGPPGRRDGRVYVDLRDGVSASWRRPRSRGLLKTPEQYGPLREIHQSDYLLVYGTQGDAEATATTRNMANVRSQRLVERAKAQAIVVPDTAVDRRAMREHSLVLFGPPSTNGVLQRLGDDLPLDVTEGAVEVGDHRYEGDLGVQFIYPNPERPENLVQVDTGTSLAGARLTRQRNFVPTQKGTADYQVYDERVRYRNWDASLAVGFFDRHWRVDPELGVLRDTT